MFLSFPTISFGYLTQGKWPIEIDGLPINSMVIFLLDSLGKISGNQKKTPDWGPPPEVFVSFPATEGEPEDVGKTWKNRFFSKIHRLEWDDHIMNSDYMI